MALETLGNDSTSFCPQPSLTTTRSSGSIQNNKSVNYIQIQIWMKLMKCDKGTLYVNIAIPVHFHSIFQLYSNLCLQHLLPTQQDLSTIQQGFGDSD